MFWVDEIAEKIIKRSPQKDLYRVHDYKTPSGRIHVGALRGVVIHNMVAQSLKNQGKQVSYVYGFDDYDPMDGFPVYLPDEFKQYMGLPLSEIPSPEPGFKNFGQYYAQEFIACFNSLGIEPEVVWASQMYKAGWYNEAIRISLDKADLIRKIYKEVSGSNRSDNWYALSVICPQCQKIGTTRVFDWNGQEVSFACEPDLVSWAKGCGYEGKISPFDGNAKLPYKVEAAAKWFNYNEDFETAGKDHMTKGGSFDVAAGIAQQVYGIEPPLGRDYPYEWLLVGGKKMSSSKGTGVSAKDVLELCPAHLLHFYIARAKPNRHLDFDPDGTTIPLLYDEYDKAIKTYHDDPSNDIAQVIQYTTPQRSIPRFVMRFSKVAFLQQMPSVDLWGVAEEEKGHALDQSEKDELEERLRFAKKWLETSAPETMRFRLQDTLPAVSLSKQQRIFLKQVEDKVKQDLDGQKLHEAIHEIKNNLGISPQEAFGALYSIFLNKTSGPQVGWFLAALNKDFVVQRLQEAIGEE